MRNQVILFLLFVPALSFANPKDLGALKLESQKAREELAKEKSFEKISKKLKDFEASINATIKDYEKANPKEGDANEEKVVKFSYRFEPLFALTRTKPDKTTCEKTRGRIEFEDLSGKEEDAPLSENAEEALKWLPLLCE